MLFVLGKAGCGGGGVFICVVSRRLGGRSQPGSSLYL